MHPILRAPLAAAATAVALLLVPVSAGAAPEARLWERWSGHDEDSRQTVDHGAWDEFLARHTLEGPQGVVRVDYGGVPEADRRALGAYVERLADVRVTGLPRGEQFAYWVNLYNALTVRVVLEHYPVDSIRDIDISPGWFADGPWGKPLVTIEGEPVTLDDIEHRILRPIWRDPRIHYAVNCASLGCPDLQREAFTAANAERLLERAAREFVAERGVRFENGELIASKIYSWFQADFGGGEAGVLDHLREHASGPLADRLAGRSEIDDYRYDWSLNDATAAR